MQKYYIIYPSGDESRIDIAQGFEYEKDDYALASRHSYTNEVEAIQNAISLAEKHQLKYVGEKLDGNLTTRHNYLD